MILCCEEAAADELQMPLVFCSCMQIFISWSGKRSKHCAELLKVWLPRVIQSVRPWISTYDIAKGSRWSGALAKELGQHVYGIICVTPENRNSPWLNFEAGALSKTDSSRTFTLLLGLTYADVEQPLAQFNHTLTTKEDMRSLVGGINESSESPLTDELLSHAFETNWAYLEERFSELTAEQPPVPDKPGSEESALRDERSLLEEILASVRGQASRTDSSAGRPSGSRINLSTRKLRLDAMIRNELATRGAAGEFTIHQTMGSLVEVRLTISGVRKIFLVDLKSSLSLRQQQVVQAVETITGFLK